ncbi:MFS transporter [Streptomyces umbrinus]|uniref:MFS transporter n=1 Tax=Streptomyces umbrinus TaxID=67370 RepID=UPI003C2F16D7
MCSPVAGRISDRTRTRLGRRRPWILTGTLLTALALVIMPNTTEVWQVVLLWCGVAVVTNLQGAAHNAVIADQVDEGRTGGVSGLVGLATALGPLLGVVLANAAPGGRADQWAAIALVAVLAGILAFLLLRETPTNAPKPPLNLRTMALTFWLDPRKHPAFGWAWLVRLLIGCAYASVAFSAFYLMERFDISKEELTGVTLRLVVLSIACVIVSTVVAGYLSDLVRRQKPFVVFAGVTAAVSLTMMAWTSDMSVVYVAVAGMGLSTGTFLSVDFALSVRVLPDKDDAAKDLAIFNVASKLPESLVPFMGPALLALGGYTALFLFLGAAGLLGALACFRLPEVGREHETSRWSAPITRG